MEHTFRKFYSSVSEPNVLEGDIRDFVSSIPAQVVKVSFKPIASIVLTDRQKDQFKTNASKMHRYEAMLVVDCDQIDWFTVQTKLASTGWEFMDEWQAFRGN